MFFCVSEICACISAILVDAGIRMFAFSVLIMHILLRQARNFTNCLLVLSSVHPAASVS